MDEKTHFIVNVGTFEHKPGISHFSLKTQTLKLSLEIFELFFIPKGNLFDGL
jgi:hypothetical protein